MVLWGVFLWKEYVASARRRFAIKAVISLIAVCALAAIVLQPLLPEDRTKGVGVIITENYKPSQLDSLRLVHNGLSVISYMDTGFKKSQLDTISKAFILGNGVAPYDFWQLEHIVTTFVGGEEIQGITSITYEQEPTVGDSLQLQGDYSKPTAGNRLVLEDAGGNGLDSIMISGSNMLRFNLRANPKVAGQFVYRLVEKDSMHKVLSSNPLPVVVKPKNILRVLIINTFPTFETKYLKNFLAENGHEVLVRSQLTKNTYKFENFNRKKGTIYGFTRSNLSAFDLVMIDPNSYVGLSNASKRAIERQMEEEGLGVFIQPDASVLNNGSRFGFRFKRTTIKEASLQEWTKVKLPVLLGTFEEGALVQPILSSQGNIWSAYSQKGAGRLSTSMFTDTYPLVLEGNEAAYHYLWSTTLSAVSQKKLPVVQWEMDDYMAYEDAPFRFKLRTSLPTPKVADGDNHQLALRQHLNLIDQWEGSVYPQEAGWNELQMVSDSTAVKAFYVAQNTDWLPLHNAARYRENIRAFNRKASQPGTVTTLQPISRWWFFIIFIIAMGYLWAAPRIDGA